MASMAQPWFGNGHRMAKNQDLFTTLRKRGLRKSVAKAIASVKGAGSKPAGEAEGAARQALKDLEKASDTIRTRVLNGSARTGAGKKAAATRKRNAAKRSAAAKRGAATRRARAESR
jgi:hypothetical protein